MWYKNFLTIITIILMKLFHNMNNLILQAFIFEGLGPIPMLLMGIYIRLTMGKKENISDFLPAGAAPRFKLNSKERVKHFE